MQPVVHDLQGRPGPTNVLARQGVVYVMHRKIRAGLLGKKLQYDVPSGSVNIKPQLAREAATAHAPCMNSRLPARHDTPAVCDESACHQAEEHNNSNWTRFTIERTPGRRGDGGSGAGAWHNRQAE
jgi:hypothetical protein